MPGSGQYSIAKSDRSDITLWGRERLHLRRNLCVLLLLALTSLLTGCGGGGGGGGTTGNGTSVSGVILRAENSAAVAGATINVGGVQGTSASDGSFLLQNVSSTVTTATLTPPSPALKRTLVLTLTKGIVNNLGNIYTSDTGYTATAVGTVVAPINGTQQPVGGATVTIAGTQVVTSTTGAFTVPNLPIGLGQDANTPVGIISATDFDPKPIFAPYVFAAGNNQLGTLLLGAPVGNTAPGQPYTIQGKVTVNGNPTAGIALLISNSAGTQLGTTSSDASGNYSFWVVPGTYTISATSGTTNKTVTVTLAALNVPVTAPTLAF